MTEGVELEKAKILWHNKWTAPKWKNVGSKKYFESKKSGSMIKFGQKKLAQKKGRGLQQSMCTPYKANVPAPKGLNGDLFAYALPFSIYQQQHQHNIAIL